jgi:hypothetical protein
MRVVSAYYPLFYIDVNAIKSSVTPTLYFTHLNTWASGLLLRSQVYTCFSLPCTVSYSVGCTFPNGLSEILACP